MFDHLSLNPPRDKILFIHSHRKYFFFRLFSWAKNIGIGIGQSLQSYLVSLELVALWCLVSICSSWSTLHFFSHPCSFPQKSDHILDQPLFQVGSDLWNAWGGKSDEDRGQFISWPPNCQAMLVLLNSSTKVHSSYWKTLQVQLQL